MNSPQQTPRPPGERPPKAARAPRQRRAAATRQRLYEAAMAEYARVGLETARVEDIVATAGVSWGTFFHYFPTKEDVLLDAAAAISRAYSEVIMAGLSAQPVSDRYPEEKRDVESILGEAFTAMREAATAATDSSALRGKVLHYVINHPGRLTAYLSDDADGDVLPPVPATTALLADGQRRGEIRDDEPAESLAVILLYAVLFSSRRAATIGRPPASTPLGRLALQIVLRGMRPESVAAVEQTLS
jgi:AcrR family transcriptional regulator